MGIVSMNCPNCGAQVEMNDGLEFGYCNMCGSKVMVDKMIVEHKGSVKIDQSEKIQKALVVARRAWDNNDIENAKRNYEAVLLEEPNNWEAYFYSTLCGTSNIRNNEIASAADRVYNCYFSTESLINAEIDDPEANFAAKNEVANAAVITLIELYRAAEAFTVSLPMGHKTQGQSFQNAVESKVFKLIGYIDGLSSTDIRFRSTATKLYKTAIDKIHPIMLLIKGVKERCVVIANRIREDEPDFKAKFELSEERAKSQGGCYVATCVYGSYDCPQVWTLRRYRDDTLASTWYGRAFIRTYYAVSPTLVKWFGKTKWFKKMWQGKLDRMVRRLNASGVADTPYNDKRW